MGLFLAVEVRVLWVVPRRCYAVWQVKRVDLKLLKAPLDYAVPWSGNVVTNVLLFLSTG